MKSIFRIFRNGLQKTKTSLWRRLQSIFTEVETWDEETFEELEAALISADLGVDVSMRIVETTRERYERGVVKTSDDILEVAREELLGIMRNVSTPKTPDIGGNGPEIILLAGVNGSGKTTTAAKLAYHVKNEGKSARLAACDTFRAAGVEQLKTLGQELDVPVTAGEKGSDAAAVAYDAASAVQKRSHDALFIDTAGRQHTSKTLMEELTKVTRAVEKAYPGAPHEVWLTVDGTTGNNAIIQAREFAAACNLTGLIITKLDGSAKGGVVVPICEELNFPVRFLGFGENMEDLQPFDPEMFVNALLEKSEE